MNKIFYLFLSFALFYSCTETTIKKKLRVVCIGDSITQGKVSHDTITQLSYRYWLWEKLDSAGFDVDMVGSHKNFFKEDTAHLLPITHSRYTKKVFDRDHESYYGITSKGILKDTFYHDSIKYLPFAQRINDPKKGYTPDVAFINIGSNDKRSDSAESVSNIKEIINILYQKNPEVIIFLQKLTTGWNAQINHSIDSIVKDFKKEKPELKIISVDMASGFINNPKRPDAMTFDWAHPNESGQKYMADKLFKAFMSLGDTIAPTFNPEIKIIRTDADSVVISWTPATDNKWVAGYDIYLDGKKANWRYSEGEKQDRQCIALVPKTEYYLKKLKPNTGYKIIIAAVDYANNQTLSQEKVFHTN